MFVPSLSWQTLGCLQIFSRWLKKGVFRTAHPDEDRRQHTRDGAFDDQHAHEAKHRKATLWQRPELRLERSKYKKHRRHVTPGQRHPGVLLTAESAERARDAAIDVARRSRNVGVSPPAAALSRAVRGVIVRIARRSGVRPRNRLVAVTHLSKNPT